jgi:site-specific recombinase XerD
LAIIDYLKNGRPETGCRCLFVKHVPPYGEINPATAHTIVSRYFEKSGIAIPQGKKHGPHALRHSLASSLLEGNVPLPVISEALGHTNTNTTGVYLKIDVENLRKCALSVPFYAEKGKAVAMFVEE